MVRPVALCSVNERRRIWENFHVALKQLLAQRCLQLLLLWGLWFDFTDSWADKSGTVLCTGRSAGVTVNCRLSFCNQCQCSKLKVWVWVLVLIIILNQVKSSQVVFSYTALNCTTACTVIHQANTLKQTHWSLVPSGLHVIAKHLIRKANSFIVRLYASSNANLAFSVSLSFMSPPRWSCLQSSPRMQSFFWKCIYDNGNR